MTYDYALGADVRCSVIFKDNAGTEADPSAVFFTVRDPEGVVTPYEYGTDVELVRSAAGRFYVIVDANKFGTWTYRFYSTGTGKAADEETFTVAPSAF